MNVTLPSDPWWLLRVAVKPGECVPMHLFMWWGYQFTTPKGLSA